MKINHSGSSAFMPIAMVLALAACSGPPPQPAPAPHGVPATAPRPAPLPSPTPSPVSAPAPRPAGTNWRDLPQTSGSWTYAAEANGSAVRFGQPGAGPLFMLRCDRSRPALVLLRAGFNAGEVPATVTTSSTSRRLTAVPVAGPGKVQNAAQPFEIVLNVRDPLLDAMAFSRGRFMLEMDGAQTLVLPAWSELGRVVEDCR